MHFRTKPTLRVMQFCTIFWGMTPHFRRPAGRPTWGEEGKKARQETRYSMMVSNIFTLLTHSEAGAD